MFCKQLVNGESEHLTKTVTKVIIGALIPSLCHCFRKQLEEGLSHFLPLKLMDLLHCSVTNAQRTKWQLGDM